MKNIRYILCDVFNAVAAYERKKIEKKKNNSP